MTVINVNSSNLTETLNATIEQIQTLRNTLTKKSELPEIIRSQKEKLFSAVQQILGFAVSVNNDTPLTQITPLFKSHKEAAEILKYFKYAVRLTKAGLLKRETYAKKDASSAAESILTEDNPFSLEYLEQQKALKRKEKEELGASSKLLKVKTGISKLRKEAEKSGLHEYVNQLDALMSKLEMDIAKANEEETNELMNMPSLAVKVA